VVSITVFGYKLFSVFESKILIDCFDSIQDILVRCLSKLLLVFSFQFFFICMCIFGHLLDVEELG
jgi:hypothetical protein